mgnify:FL=1
MKKGEVFFFGGTFLFCAIYLIASIRMRFGSLQEPGPGLLPVALGVAGLAISLGLCIQPLMMRAIVQNEGMSKTAMLRLLGYILTVALYAGTLNIIGTYAGIFIMVVSLSKITGLKGWLNPLVLAGGCSVVAFVLFDLALGVPLPTGFFEGWF